MPPAESNVPHSSEPVAAGQKPAVQRAGEGGGLPKGLSLFRFVLFSCLMLGGIYGGVSLYFSAPPPLGDVAPSGGRAENWEPSLLCLPAYITFKLELGVRATLRGYIYTSQLGRAFNASATIFLGMLLGGIIGWFAGEQIRKYAVRKRYE